MNGPQSVAMPEVPITDKVVVGPGKPLLVIAGPCQIESREHCRKIASAVSELRKINGIHVVFKASFDKANRTSIHGARGLGIDQGLSILGEIRQEFNLPVLTDVHTVDQVPLVAEVVDILQTPAFLCRQTDLLRAVGKTGRAVNVKKGQFLAPQDMRHVADKIATEGNRRIMLCERGTCFGYRDLIVDMRSLVQMRQLGYPVIFDATHSVQSIGGLGGSSGGERSLVAPLARAAVAVGIDGVFLECHDNPDSAPSDGPSMLHLNSVAPLVRHLVALRNAGESALEDLSKCP